MNQHEIDSVTECSRGSHDGRLSFPEVVGKLMAAGVERYHADFSRGEITYYMPDGSSHVVKNEEGADAAGEFSPGAVQAAIRAIQARAMNYRQFCAAILAAGCVGYFVCLTGRRAIYFGRMGDNYVEPFPKAA
jgi:uncharacterized protein YbcV (DUF1398 family)